MTPEFEPMDSRLEQAVAELRDEIVDPAVVEAAASRVWVRLSEAAIAAAPVIRNCADFQALIPDMRAGRLSEARAMLLRDHLHQCVACRHVYEGKVTTMPSPAAGRNTSHMMRWAVAASVLLAAGVTVWLTENRNGDRNGNAIVKTLDGTLYAVTADGMLSPLTAGKPLPMDTELRTAPNADAVLQLSDGSEVEMRERSSLSTSSSAPDLSVRLGRGSVIVRAAKRRAGHLYVDTSDCRVAVTGTVFGVTTGMKGSRVSVLQGEVHVTMDNQEKVLHAGDQTETSSSVEPEPVNMDVAWSRTPEKSAPNGNAALHLATLRYDSRLLNHVPAGTVLYVSIPNEPQYLDEAASVLQKKIEGNPQLHAMWSGHIGAAVEVLRGASEYLGDEVDIIHANGQAPVLFAEQRRAGLEDFLKKKNLNFAVLHHGDVLVFGPERTAVESANSQFDSGFSSKPLYARITQTYREGAGLFFWAELPPEMAPFPGAHYLFAETKQDGKQTVASAALGFDGPRTGMAAELAAPSPMGSLDYISPDALAALGFVVKGAGAIVDSALAITHGSMAAAQQALNEEKQQNGFDVRQELAASLGGEFAIAEDGPFLPVPSWKLVSEIYDPARFQATLQRFVELHNQKAVATGSKPIRLGQETFEGRTYYSIAQADSGPLLEAHYTFDRGYLVAGPTRALVAQALRIETAGTSLKHSSKFLELTPHDHHVNFSAVIYQNLGNSLAPLASLASAFAPQAGGGRPNMLQGLDNLKPTLYAVYGEPDRITMTANGDVLSSTLSNLLSGNLAGMAGVPLPMGQFGGTRTPHPAYAK